MGRPTVVFESGLAGPVAAWFPVAKLLEPEFDIAIHKRSGSRLATLQDLAAELEETLSRSAIQKPVLLVGHSFGALVARQYAVRYPRHVQGLVFVDGLPPDSEIGAPLIRRAMVGVRLLQFASRLGISLPVLKYLRRHVMAVDWGFLELAKYPAKDRESILAEWQTAAFYQTAAQILETLPENIRCARELDVPSQIPVISLHSDYPDSTGRHIPDAGHWIQIDQPGAVADAVRELAAMS